MLLVLLLLLHGTVADIDLPYPSSSIPTGGDGQIYVWSVYNQTLPDRVTVSTLSGVLARRSPKIYVIKSQDPTLTNTSFNDDTTVWLHDLSTHHNISFNLTYLHNFTGLLDHFRRSVHGVVAYDPDSKSTNAALIRCAANEGYIAAGSPSTLSFLTSTLNVKLVANVSSSTPHEEFVHSKATLSKRGMVAQPDDGSKSFAMSGYAVFARMPTVEHNTNDVTITKTFDAVVSNFDSSKLNVAFGWTSNDEHAFTASVTQSGGMVHASDYLYNLEFFSQLPPYQHDDDGHPNNKSDAAPTSISPLAPSSQPVHTVAFVFSDGDNLQLLQNDWISSTHWNSPQRGLHNIGWSYSPSMAVLMPSLLSYVVRTSTSKDSLSTGPSGIGYAYPNLFPNNARQMFAVATASLMKQSGMTIANVIGVVPSKESVSDLAQQSDIQALVYFTFGNATQGYAGLHGNVAYEYGTPVIGLRKNLWGGDPSSKDKLEPKELAEQLKLLPKNLSDPGSYTIVVNELGNGIASILETIALLDEAGGFEIVLPEVLVNKLTTNTKRKNQCPLASGPWSKQAGILPKCWFPDDNASCVMTCDTINILKVPIRCDLNVCSNLRLTKYNTKFECVETGQVCPGAG